MDKIDQQLAALTGSRQSPASKPTSRVAHDQHHERQLVSARQLAAVVAASAIGLFAATLSPALGVVLAAIAGGLLSGLLAGLVATGVTAAGGPAVHAALLLMASPLDWVGALVGLLTGIALRLTIRSRFHRSTA